MLAKLDDADWVPKTGDFDRADYARAKACAAEQQIELRVFLRAAIRAAVDQHLKNTRGIKQ
jgi:hypothetical protein